MGGLRRKKEVKMSGSLQTKGDMYYIVINMKGVCKFDDGRQLSPNYVSHKFRSIIKQSNLPVIRFHDLRHTTATLLIGAGFSLKEIQDWLGHGSIVTTADIYGHLDYKSKLNIANNMSKIILSSF